MAETRSTTLTVRVHLELKEVLHTAAERGHRSIANMVAVLIMDYCGRNNIPVQLDPADRRKGAAK